MKRIVLDYKGCHADSKHIDNCINYNRERYQISYKQVKSVNNVSFIC